MICALSVYYVLIQALPYLAIHTYNFEQQLWPCYKVFRYRLKLRSKWRANASCVNDVECSSNATQFRKSGTSDAIGTLFVALAALIFLVQMSCTLRAPRSFCIFVCHAAAAAFLPPLCSPLSFFYVNEMQLQKSSVRCWCRENRLSCSHIFFDYGHRCIDKKLWQRLLKHVKY